MASSQPPYGVAFLLTQLGTQSAQDYASRITAHGLTPPQTGILGLLRANPGLSQQELATMLDMLPSRVVALVDELEEAALVERVRDEVDRRRNRLELTDAGGAALRTVAAVSRAHEAAMTSALTDSERATLRKLLDKIRVEQGLAPGVHPGYRTLQPR